MLCRVLGEFSARNDRAHLRHFSSLRDGTTVRAVGIHPSAKGPLFGHTSGPSMLHGTRALEGCRSNTFVGTGRSEARRSLFAVLSGTSAMCMMLTVCFRAHTVNILIFLKFVHATQPANCMQVMIKVMVTSGVRACS